MEKTAAAAARRKLDPSLIKLSIHTHKQASRPVWLFRLPLTCAANSLTFFFSFRFAGEGIS